MKITTKRLSFLTTLLCIPMFLTCCANKTASSDNGGSSIEECNHIYEESFVEPTIDEKGYTLHHCTKCGHEYKDGYTGLFTEEEEQAGLSFLFIGNSYTFFVSNNTYPYQRSTFMNFKEIAESAGFEVEVDNVTTGGYSLLQHADPTNDDGALLREKLQNGAYDLAFMQEQSVTPVTKPAAFYEGARKVYGLLQEQGIRGCMYETWGRKAESADLARYGLTNDTMTQILIGNYAAIADELGIPVSHAGTAFYDVYTNHKDIIELYNADNFHPSLYGAYLIAYVHYATVYGLSPVGLDVFGYQYEEILQQAAHDAVFGPSILRDEYKTSSVGVGLTIPEEEKTVELDAAVPTEFLNTGYHLGVGGWNITKDENGIATFVSTGGKDSLIFDTELFEGSGTISFNLKVDGTFTGASTQGVVFGSSIDQISWTTGNDTFYTVGRDKEGHMGITSIIQGSVGNFDGYDPSKEVVMPDITKTYNIKLVIDRERAWTIKSFVDGEYAGLLIMGDHLLGKYVGLSSGLNGGATISNIQINGKGLNVDLNEVTPPDEPEEYDYVEINTDTDVNVTRGAVKLATNAQGHKVYNLSGENAMIVIKDYTLTNDMAFEFDVKWSNDYSGACTQGVVLGCSTATFTPYLEGASAHIGRLKSGKVGGVVIENSSDKTKPADVQWKYASQISSGDALNAMKNADTTYHVKVVYRYVSEKSIEADLYVNDVLARSLSYTSTTYNFGEYFGFSNGKDGSATFSNIKIGGNIL